MICRKETASRSRSGPNMLDRVIIRHGHCCCCCGIKSSSIAILLLDLPFPLTVTCYCSSRGPPLPPACFFGPKGSLQGAFPCLRCQFAGVFSRLNPIRTRSGHLLPLLGYLARPIQIRGPKRPLLFGVRLHIDPFASLCS
jgi:hypothetical protein